jgi:uncharacterized protein YjiS (DUF1127 family)
MSEFRKTLTLSESDYRVAGDRQPGGFSLLRWLANRFARAIRTGKDFRRLAALDDRMLGDIGVSRGALESAVWGGRGALRGDSWQEELDSMDLHQLADLPIGPEPHFVVARRPTRRVS